MKKKTLFLSLMAGVALLGSCTREALSTSPDGYAVVPEGAIVFDTRVSGTKAVTETTASTLQTQGFNVYGLAVTTPLEGDPTFEEYMDNVTVSNHDGVYYGSTTYYWPAGKTMDFYCANAGKEISSTDGAATLAYTLDANRQYDLVAAKSIGASSGTVSLTFAHLLSQLQLKVLGLDENATYTLTSLSVTAPTVGTYAFSRDGSDSWTSLGTAAAYSVYSGDGQAVSTSSAATVGTTMAFFPGTATVRAQWTCKVDDQVIGTYDNTALVTLSKGKVNTVTLKLPNASAEPIRFSMSVNAWTNAEDAEVQMGPSATIAVSASAEETVTLPQMTLSSGTTLVIDWKDGTTDTYEYGVSRTVLNDGTVTPSHTYSEAISDRVSLYVTGNVTITTETPEVVNVADDDAVDVVPPPVYSFAGLKIAPGPLYYNGTSYEIKDSWNYAQNIAYGNSGDCKAYFSYVELGELFEKSGFAFSDGSIDNLLDPFDGWRLPTKEEWESLIGLTRDGSTVNGEAGKHYAGVGFNVTFTYDSGPKEGQQGNASHSGLLLFPDGKTITGKELVNTDFELQGIDSSIAWATTMTLAELCEYLEQDCAFLPFWGGYYDNEYMEQMYGVNITTGFLSSTINGESGAYWLSQYESTGTLNVAIGTSYGSRYGYPTILVKPVE